MLNHMAVHIVTTGLQITKPLSVLTASCSKGPSCTELWNTNS